MFSASTQPNRSICLFVQQGITSAAFALALGANNLDVGLMAARPFLSRIIRIPSIPLVERVRARKALALPSLVGMQLAAPSSVVMESTSPEEG